MTTAPAFNLPTVEATHAWLGGLTEPAVSRIPAPGVWSPKQVLGHLIDSACNNQDGWARMSAQDGLAFPTWDQDGWMQVQDWQAEPWADTLTLWHAYNRHLARFAALLPAASLGHRATIGTLNGGQPMTLAQLRDHYARHLHHHLAQIRERVA